MTSKVYSAPRVFDVATLFVVTFAYAILFSILSFSFDPKSTILWGGSFVTAVGICQAVLFQGDKPRQASLVGGVVFAIVYLIYQNLVSTRQFNPIVFVISAPFFALFGAGFGYLAGAVVGGVFLVADHIRQAWGRRFPRTQNNEVHYSPFTE